MCLEERSFETMNFALSDVSQIASMWKKLRGESRKARELFIQLDNELILLWLTQRWIRDGKLELEQEILLSSQRKKRD
eukprot:UN17675